MAFSSLTLGVILYLALTTCQVLASPPVLFTPEGSEGADISEYEGCLHEDVIGCDRVLTDIALLQSNTSVLEFPDGHALTRSQATNGPSSYGFSVSNLDQKEFSLRVFFNIVHSLTMTGCQWRLCTFAIDCDWGGSSGVRLHQLCCCW